MQAFIEEEALELMQRASEGSASETEMGQLRDLLGSSPSLAQTLQTTAQIKVAEELKSKASVDTSLQISKYYLDFGTKDKKCALNSVVSDKIRIVNTGSKTVKLKFPDSLKKANLYQLSVSPCEVKLKKGSSVDITVEVSVCCTTRLKEIITMRVQDSGICHFFSIRVDSVMSQVLDYSELNIHSMVGSGGFGTVHKATWRGLPVAVKKITEEGEEFYQEFQAHREIAHHPNVVHFVGMCVSPQAIVCEFIEGGSLDAYLHKATTKLGKRIRLKIAHEIAKGMVFLHENDLLHLDLKPQNFLVVSLSYSAPISIKLADFGVSQTLVSQTFRGRKVEGSFLYMAPEVLLHAQFSRAADVWSYGACLIEILTDHKPYYEYEKLSYLELVKKRNDLEIPGVPETCDPELAQLISSCLRVDRTKRPTFEQIVKVLDQYIESHEDSLDDGVVSPELRMRSPSVSSLLSQDILGTTPNQPSPPFPRSSSPSGPISPKTSPPSSAPPSPFGTPPRSPRSASSSVPVPVHVPSRPYANAQQRIGSPSSLYSSSPSPSSSPNPNTPPVPPPRNFASSAPRSIVIPPARPHRPHTPSSPASPSFRDTSNTPASPSHSERASALKHSNSFVVSSPSNLRPTSPILAVARNNSQYFSRSTSPSLSSSPAPSSPLSLSSPGLNTPPAVPPRPPLRKFSSTREEFSEDTPKKINPLLQRATALQRTVTDPQIFRMSDEYPEQTKSAPSSQPSSPCANELPSSPSFITASNLAATSDSLDDPKIESLRHLTQTNFKTAVTALEDVFDSLKHVCSLKLAIELSKQILAYKRSLESACETFLSVQWEGVKQFLLDAPRANADDFEYTPPSPSLFSSPESYTHVSALLAKTAIVLSQALDILHYLALRLSSPSSVSEVLTLAKCARWIKNNARLTTMTASASIVTGVELEKAMHLNGSLVHASGAV